MDMQQVPTPPFPRGIRGRLTLRRAVITALAALVPAIATSSAPAVTPDARGDLLMIVDCLLPGQVRTLGTRTTYLSARRPARLPARDCQIRGGEYVAYDRADWRSALGAWLPAAESGDVEAQLIVGEIHERGLGVAPDYATAARWYRMAAEAGSRKAQVNLGFLLERGLGAPADPAAAVAWYRRAAGSGVDIEIEPAPLPADAETASLRQRTAELEATLAQLRAELEASRRALEAADAEAAAARAEARAATEQTAAARDDAAAARAHADAASADAEAARAAAAAAERQAAQLAARPVPADRGAEVARLQQDVELRSQEVAAISAALEQARAANDEQRRALEAAARDAATAQQSVAAERARLAQVSAALAAREAELAARQADAERLTRELAALQSQLVARDGATRDIVKVADGDAAPAAVLRGAPAGVEFGNYHALIIGNNDYRQLPDLASPINDAKDLAQLLERRYGFRTTVLLDADRYQILSALNRMRETLTSKDNLLVYFAGHGELDEINQRGHWLPVDAERDSNANWIPNTAITDILNVMQARQVMLIVDSCYAGTLTRSSIGRLRTGMTDDERRHWMRTMVERRARTVLTSGGIAPVMDAGGGRHSVFAKALLEVLQANDEVIDGARLHRDVAARVAYAAAGLQFDQVPEYAPIRFAGHEAGEFFLVPRS
jgi:hypothetical protein